MRTNRAFANPEYCNEKRSRSTVLFAAIALSCSALCAQSTQLTPTYAEGAGVDQLFVSPDERWAFFTAHDEAPDCASLYRVAVDGGAVTRLSPPPLAQCSLSVRGFTADGERLIFSRYRGGPSDLYSIGVAEPPEALVPLETSMQSGEQLALSWIAGSSVAFVTLEAGEATLRLVPAAGPETATVVLGEDTFSVRVVEPSGRLVYLDEGALFSRELSVDAIPVRLDASSGGGSVDWFDVSPNGNLVAFAGNVGGVMQVFAVPINGPAAAAVRIDEDLPAGEAVPPYASYFEFSPNGTWALMHSFVGAQATGGALYSMPTHGSGPMQRLDQSSDQSFEFGFTSDGTTVLFLAKQDNPDRLDLYSVPRAGPPAAARRLNPATDQVNTYSLLADGDTVIYRAGDAARRSGPAFEEFFRISATDPLDSSYRLSGLGLDTRVAVSGSARQMGERWIYTGQIYTGQIDDGPERELFSVRIEGPRERSAVRLNSNPEKANVASFLALQEGNWLAFSDRAIYDEQWLVFMAKVSGAGEAESVHVPLPPWFTFGSFRVAPSRGLILYTIRAEAPTPQGATLFMRRLPDVFADGFESGDTTAWF